MSNTTCMSAQAYAYLRVSGKAQIGGDGFTRQREAILNRCSSIGVEITREFIEMGVSGTGDMDDRPALAEMFAALMDNGVKLVIVERADRFSRDLMVGEVLLKQFNDIGVTVIEAEEGRDLTVNDPDNATGVLVRQIFAVIAQFEKTSIVAKLRKARARKKQETGRCEGVKPYGALSLEEAHTLETMKRLRAQGGTVRSIADYLNTHGNHPTRTGRPWNYSVVAKILSRHLQEQPDNDTPEFS